MAGRSKAAKVTQQPEWLSHAFVSRLASQVSFPYRRPEGREIVRANGGLTVTFAATGPNRTLPYGRYPRLIEMWMATMVKTGGDCWDPETRTISMGSSFRRFMRLIGAEVGGKSLRNIRVQIENMCSCSYAIENRDDTGTTGVNFVVAERYHIGWLDGGSQADASDNWITLSKGYTEKLVESPVPVSLEKVALLTKPMSLDIYAWLSRRFSYLHSSTLVTWDQLRGQFGGGSATMRRFRQTFRAALADVLEVYPEARVTVGPSGVTLHPSATSVPTVHEVRAAAAKPGRRSDGGHWTAVRPYGRVWTTSELFDVDAARAHFEGTVPVGSCVFCGFDERNGDTHGSRPGHGGA